VCHVVLFHLLIVWLIETNRLHFDCFHQRKFTAMNCFSISVRMNDCWEFAFSVSAENTLKSLTGKGKRGF
jgi:hypothetical protein